MLANNELQLATFPFQNCIIISYNFNRKQSAYKIESWKNVGQTITTLKIQNCSFYGKNGLRQIIFHHTPNLQVLVLCQYMYHSRRTEIGDRRTNLSIADHQISLDQVQRKLKTLKIETSKKGNDSDLSITWMKLLLHFPNVEVSIFLHKLPICFMLKLII